jgi:hypothetical protein
MFHISKSMGSIATMAPLATAPQPSMFWSLNTHLRLVQLRSVRPMSHSYPMNSLYEAPRFPSSNAVHAEDTSVLLARLEAMSLKQEQLEQRNEELEAIIAGIPRGGTSNHGSLGAHSSIFQGKQNATRRLVRILPELNEDTAAENLPSDAQTSEDSALDDARSNNPEGNSEERQVGTYHLGGKVSEMQPTVKAARGALHMSR